MQSRDFYFYTNYDFSTQSVFNCINPEFSPILPPIIGNFELLDGTPFLLLDGTNFLLL